MASRENELIYTGLIAIKPSAWIYFREQSQDPSEVEMTRRIVGGDVWLEDTHIGPATAADCAKLPTMRVAGDVRVSGTVASLSARGG